MDYILDLTKKQVFTMVDTIVVRNKVQSEAIENTRERSQSNKPGKNYDLDKMSPVEMAKLGVKIS